MKFQFRITSSKRFKIYIHIFFLLLVYVLNSSSVYGQQPELVLPLGHTYKVNTVVFSPDDNYVLTSSADKTVKIWSVQTGKLVYTLDGHTDDVLSASFSSDGEKIFTISRDRTIKTWDAQNGKMLNSSLCPMSSFNLPTLTKDGKKLIVTSHDDGTMSLWDVTEDHWKLIRKIEGYAFSIHFSPNEKQIITTSEKNSAQIWNVENGILIHTLSGHSDRVVSAIFSPDGKNALTLSDDKTAILWDVQNGKRLRVFSGHKDWLTSAAFSPDGKMIVTSSADKTARIWNVESGKNTAILEGQMLDVVSAFYSNDGKIVATASLDGSTVLWDAQNGKKLQGFNGVCYKQGSGRYDINGTFSIDGKRIVANDYNGAPKIIDVKSGKVLHTLAGHSKPIQFARFSPDGLKVITANDQSIRIWDIRNGKLLFNCKGHKNRMRDVEFSHDGKYFLSNSEDGTIRVWETESGKQQFVIQGPGWAYKDVFFSSDNKKIITLSEKEPVKIWDAKKGNLLYSLPAIGKSMVTLANFNPDGSKIITASSDGYVRLWDSENGKQLFQIDALSMRMEDIIAGVYNAIFSPDGKSILTYSEDGAVRIWDAANGNLISSPDGITAAICKSPFSPDSRFIALDCLNEENNISTKMFDVQSGKVLLSMQGMIQGSTDNPFSPDSKYLVCVTKEKTIQIADVHVGKITNSIETEDKEKNISQVMFTPDSKSLIIEACKANDKGYIYLYEPMEIWDFQQGKKKITIDYHSGLSKDILWKDSLILFASNAKASLLSLIDGKERVSFIAMDEEDYVFVLPSGEYMGTTQGVKLLSWRMNNQLFDFDQWDIQYNRPDKVVAALNHPDTALIHMYRNAYLKRLQKTGFNEKMFSPEWHTPEIKILNMDDRYYASDQPTWKLKISASDSQYKINRILIWINGVPLYGQNGWSAKNENASLFEKEISLDLTPGTNRIEVSCINEKGVESFRKSVEVVFEPKEKVISKRYFFAVSVSQYKDSRYNLNYSVKDGRDMSALFAGKLFRDKNSGTSAICDTLFNTYATHTNILALKKELLKTTVNDEVIFFVSGHGLLSKTFDFYFATYDMDFQQPEKYGISFVELEDLLDSIPARKKLLLIDACHSGEVDKEEISGNDDPVTLADGARGIVKTYSFKGASLTNKNNGASLQNSFDLMQDLFVNLSRGSGTTVISAAAGKGYALESAEWNNGVFTFSILNGLKKFIADKNHDKIITISELKEYVRAEVMRLTNGAQKPTNRRDTGEDNWIVW